MSLRAGCTVIVDMKDKISYYYLTSKPNPEYLDYIFGSQVLFKYTKNLFYIDDF